MKGKGRKRGKRTVWCSVSGEMQVFAMYTRGETVRVRTGHGVIVETLCALLGQEATVELFYASRVNKLEKKREKRKIV